MKRVKTHIGAYFIVGLLAAGFLFIANTHASLAATFTVTNTTDSGAGSFRKALDDANANPGPDQVDFAIPGSGPHTISATSYFPELTGGSIKINGQSQPGTVCNGSSTLPQIVLNGYAGGRFRIADGAEDSEVNGISMPDGSVIVSADNTKVRCNFFGINPDNSRGSGGYLHIEQGTNNVTVGGSSAQDFNLISPQSQGDGVTFDGNGTGLLVEGNYIGTDITGTQARGLTNGINIRYGNNNEPPASNIVIKDNVISGNQGFGVAVNSLPKVTDVTLSGNKIGIDADGRVAVPNAHGIWLSGILERINIGGPSVDERNIIAGNLGLGISTDNASMSDFVIENNYFGTDNSGSNQVVSGTNTRSPISLNGLSIGAGVIKNNIVVAYDNNWAIVANGGSSGLVIEGNKVGIKADQSGVLGVQNVGIYSNSPNAVIRGNSIGGITDNGSGIFVDGSSAVLEGNYIGTDSTRTRSLGGNSTGVYIRGSALTGSLNPSLGNVISNVSRAVATDSNGDGSTVLGNTITNTSDAPIYHWSNTAVPKITQFEESGGSTQLTVNLDYNFQDGDYRLEFYSNPTPRNSHGQYELTDFAGFVDVTKNGSDTLQVTIPTTGITNPTVTVTQKNTDPETFGRTSFVGGYQPTADLAASLSVSPAGQCAVAGEQNRIYQITVTNNGPSSVNQFEFTAPQPDGFHENVAITVSGGTASSTDITHNSGQSWLWDGDMSSGQTVVVTVSVDIESSPTNSSAHVGFGVSPYNNSFEETNSSNNYTSSSSVYICGTNTNLKLELLARPDQTCMILGEQNRTYRIRVTNNGPSTIKKFGIQALRDNSLYENTTTSVVGGTAATTSFTELQSAGSGEWLWEGLIAAGQTVELETNGDITASSSSTNEDLTIAVNDSGSSGSYYTESNNDDNALRFTEPLCSFAADLELTLSGPTECMVADGHTRQYVTTITNHGPATVETFRFRNLRQSDVFNSVTTVITGGTGVSTALDASGGDPAQGQWNWTGQLAAGQTVEITTTFTVGSDSSFIGDNMNFEVDTRNNDLIDVNERNNSNHKFLIYCDKIADISSEIALESPGLSPGQPATYLLRSKNNGPAGIGTDGRGIFLFGLFPEELSVTGLGAVPVGYQCSIMPASEADIAGAATGTVVMCVSDGTEPINSGEVVQFTVNVLASSGVNSATKVSMISGSEGQDPDIFNISSGDVDIFSLAINNVAHFYGTSPGSSLGQQQPGDGGENPGPSISLNDLNKSAQKLMLAKSGADQKHTLIVAVVLTLLASVKLLQIMRRRFSAL